MSDRPVMSVTAPRRRSRVRVGGALAGLAAVAAFATAGPAAAADAPLENGSFELPDLPAGEAQRVLAPDELPGWGSPSGAVLFQDAATAVDGDQYVETRALSAAFQTVADQTYTLTMSYGASTASCTDPQRSLNIAITSAAPYSVSTASQFTATPQIQWKHVTISFVGGGDTFLRIAGGSGDCGVALDGALIAEEAAVPVVNYKALAVFGGIAALAAAGWFALRRRSNPSSQAETTEVVG